MDKTAYLGSANVFSYLCVFCVFAILLSNPCVFCYLGGFVACSIELRHPPASDARCNDSAQRFFGVRPALQAHTQLEQLLIQLASSVISLLGPRQGSTHASRQVPDAGAGKFPLLSRERATSLSQRISSGLHFSSTYRTPRVLTSNAVLIPTTPSNTIMRSSQSKTSPNSAVSLETSRRLMEMNTWGFTTRSSVPKVGREDVI
jgi:hypothetical protein